MASGMDLGPVPEFEGHRLASLHSRSRSWGQAGTALLCVGMFFGAGALGRAALSHRPVQDRARTVTVSLSEDAPVPLPGRGAAEEMGSPEPSQPSSLQPAAVAPEPASPALASPTVPASRETLPEVIPGLSTHTAGLPGASGGSAGGHGMGALTPGHGKGTGSGPAMGSGSALHVSVDHAASYRASLANWLAARKRYPAAARNQGRQGEVLLTLEMDAAGVLTQVRVERSSGHDLLDQAALALVKGCGTLPPPPSGLRLVRVAVDYSLA